MNASFLKVHSEREKGLVSTSPQPKYGTQIRVVWERDLGDFIAKYNCNLKE